MKVMEIQNDTHYKNLLSYLKKKEWVYENHQIERSIEDDDFFSYVAKKRKPNTIEPAKMENLD